MFPQSSRSRRAGARGLGGVRQERSQPPPPPKFSEFAASLGALLAIALGVALIAQCALRLSGL